MLALGIETATSMGSVALVDDGAGVLAEHSLNSKASHSERLLPSIDGLFKETGKRLDDCAVVCVSRGPGSFTGLRIGLATAKGLAYAISKPIVGVSTLEILARGLPFLSIPVCTVIDARKKELFTCIYEWHGLEFENLTREMVIKPDALIRMIERPTLFAGDGLVNYGDFIAQELKGLAIFASRAFNFPRASVLAGIGLKRFAEDKSSEPDDILPVYIRDSEAEVNWRKRPDATGNNR